MRTICMWVMFVVMTLINVSVSTQSSENFTREFNDGWKFHKGDVEGAMATGFSDPNWRTVDLPHDWSIEGPFSQEWAAGTGFVPGGIGWYRKSFETEPTYRDKRVTIEFEGIYRNSNVWINGHHLGYRPYGYINFNYDLTPFLNKAGETNVIAVKVDHSEYADSRWYTGSGITRNVHLHVTEKLHFPYHSIYVSTIRPTRVYLNCATQWVLL